MGHDPDPGVVVDRAGRANLRLFGGWTNVRGAVGRAVRFRWNGRPAGGTVRSGTAFTPGSAPFAVGVTLRGQAVPASGGYSPNIVQKGLFHDRGQWKMEVIRSGTRGRPMPSPVRVGIVRSLTVPARRSTTDGGTR